MIDFNLDQGAPIKNGEISLIIQQIDMLFDTTPRDILGYEDWGTRYDKFLYDLKLSNAALANAVMSDMTELDLFGFVPHVEVHLLQGTEQDIALVEINLTRDNEHYQRIYKIS